jgi:hypothetical protein
MNDYHAYCIINWPPLIFTLLNIFRHYWVSDETILCTRLLCALHPHYVLCLRVKNSVQGYFKCFGWWEISVFCSWIHIKSWNNLKTALTSIKFIRWRSIYAQLITLQLSTRYLNSSHVRCNCDFPTFATDYDICFGNFWLNCSIGRSYV